MNHDDIIYTSVYRHSPVGLVIVDSNTDLVEINNYMLKMFRIDSVNYQGRKFGNVFNCASLRDDQICGTAEPCSSCNLRGGVTDVLEKEIVISEFQMNHRFIIDHIPSEMWFKISSNTITLQSEKFAVISFVDITKEKQYEELLQYRLTLDLATGVLNKMTLLETIQGLAKDSGTPCVFSIGIIDFDNFKSINDRFGHLMGDQVLKEFSDLARSEVRDQDIIGRYGGDEFMFIFPGIAINDASKIMHRICRDLSHRFQPNMSVSFSAGFIEISGTRLTSMTGNQIINTIDAYLYSAKRDGKQRFASENMNFDFV